MYALGEIGAARGACRALNRPCGSTLALYAANGASSSAVRYSSLVMPMPCSPEMTPPRLRASAMIRATAAFASLQHRVVVGVDRADSCARCRRRRACAARRTRGCAASRAGSRCSAPSPARTRGRRRSPRAAPCSSVFHDADDRAVLQRRERRVDAIERGPASARARRRSARALRRPSRRSSSGARPRVVVRPPGVRERGPAKNAASASQSSSLFASESSMLIRSMPSV